MKSKQQKRQEAIARASVSYHVKRWDKRGLSLEEYLNQFRSADERVAELGEPESTPTHGADGTYRAANVIET